MPGTLSPRTSNALLFGGLGAFASGRFGLITDWLGINSYLLWGAIIGAVIGVVVALATSQSSH